VELLYLSLRLLAWADTTFTAAHKHTTKLKRLKRIWRMG
jgi:hypothetical protein